MLNNAKRRAAGLFGLCVFVGVAVSASAAWGDDRDVLRTASRERSYAESIYLKQQQLEDLRSRVSELQGDIDGLNSDIADLGRKADEVRPTVPGLGQKLNDAAAERDTTKGAMDAAAREVRRLEIERANVIQRLAAAVDREPEMVEARGEYDRARQMEGAAKTVALDELLADGAYRSAVVRYTDAQAAVMSVKRDRTATSEKKTRSAVTIMEAESAVRKIEGAVLARDAGYLEAQSRTREALDRMVRVRHVVEAGLEDRPERLAVEQELAPAEARLGDLHAAFVVVDGNFQTAQLKYTAATNELTRLEALANEKLALRERKGCDLDYYSCQISRKESQLDRLEFSLRSVRARN